MKASLTGTRELFIGVTAGLIAGPFLLGDTLLGTLVLLAGISLGEAWWLSDTDRRRAELRRRLSDAPSGEGEGRDVVDTPNVSTAGSLGGTLPDVADTPAEAPEEDETDVE